MRLIAADVPCFLTVMMIRSPLRETIVPVTLAFLPAVNCCPGVDACTRVANKTAENNWNNSRFECLTMKFIEVSPYAGSVACRIFVGTGQTGRLLDYLWTAPIDVVLPS